VGDINLEVWDATGNKRLKVQVPDDVPVERILMVLADKLHLPRYGQLMSYFTIAASACSSSMTRRSASRT
jgi:hypothetical protein